nr:reverse transcriptase domain-containing protein [Tanacetum cinerariifolium]
MRPRNSYFSNNSSATISRRRNKRRTLNIVKPELRTTVQVVDNHTMEELLQAPTEGDVPNNVIKLMMFSYSLEGNARVWRHFGEAWEQFKEMLRACPYHGFTALAQIDTFYNGLNDNDQDSLNAAAGGNLFNQPSVCVTTGTYNQVAPQNRASNFMAPPGFAPDQSSTSSTLSSNTIPNPKGEMKAITTRSGVAYKVTSIPTLKKLVEQETEEITDKEQTNFQRSTAHIQPPVTPISESDVLKTLPKPNIPYPSRLNDQKLYEKATNQMDKFFQIFQDLHFDISFSDDLLLMPKFASTIKSLLTNKDKLFELAKIPLNENCSAMLLKKLPEKLRDLGKFLIPCDFPGMDVCHALADLGASINLMPLSIWKKLSLPELTPTRMTLELADRSITRPKGVVEVVFIKVGKFHFLTNFLVVDFEADHRVPFILGRSFLRNGRALIDVYGEEITLRVNDEAVTFNLNQTTRYTSTYNDLSVNQIDIIDVAKEEYAQEILGFSSNFSGGNPTSTFEHILSDSSLTVTSFEGSDFILEEISAYLKDESVSPEIDHADCDPEGDICLIENLLNNDPFQLPPMDLKQEEVVKEKSLIEEPLELELKGLSSHLEYAYLEGADKLPVIISKGLKVNEKEAILKVLKSHKRAIALKITNIKGIDLRFSTHKILMEEDYKSAVQSQRRVNLKIHDVIKKEVIKLLDAEEIFLGHKISKNGLEVDRSKVDVIAKLPYPMTVKGVRSFLGHASFYRRFIQDFSKIARPITHLLEKETPFVFFKDCIDAFETLKKKLTEAPILVFPDWNLPFELCVMLVILRLVRFWDNERRSIFSLYIMLVRQ